MIEISLHATYKPIHKHCNNQKRVLVNGFVCKTQSERFLFLWPRQAPHDTGNRLGSNVTAVNVNQIPGLNTLGISLARIDFAPYGLNPPHFHPGGTEILTVLEGTLYVGFVASNNQLFTKVLKKGDVFVFPQGLVHFQFNYGKTNAVAIAGLSSQNPGVITVANAVFGAKPSQLDSCMQTTSYMISPI